MRGDLPAVFPMARRLPSTKEQPPLSVSGGIPLGKQTIRYSKAAVENIAHAGSVHQGPPPNQKEEIPFRAGLSTIFIFHPHVRPSAVGSEMETG
jgi:hypothetical protein